MTFADTSGIKWWPKYCPKCGSEMFPQNPGCVEPESYEMWYCVSCGHEEKARE